MSLKTCTKLLSQTTIIQEKHFARNVALKDISLVIISITFAVQVVERRLTTTARNSIALRSRRLIAIMLGQLRMTVPDCLSEYVKLGHEVFGKPRMVPAIRFGLGARAKYKGTRLKEMVQDIIKRHNGEPRKHHSEKVAFQSGRGLCAT